MERIEHFDFTPVTKKSVLRVVYSLRDFEMAGHALGYLRDSVDFTAGYKRDKLVKFSCYETAAIISFCRPISKDSDGNRLSFEEIGVTLSTEETELIKLLRRLRDKIFAHSDVEEMHYRIDLIDPKIDGIKLPFPHIQFDFSLKLSEEQTRLMAEIISNLCRQINRYIILLAKEKPKLVEKYVYPTHSQ